MKVTVVATYDTVEWVEDQDGPCEDPLEDGGFCDPCNPWGGMQTEDPQEVTFDSLGEAAQFAIDFPGGIWDWSESESEQDYRTGVWKSVTLHIRDHQEAVFALMDMLNHCSGGDRKYVWPREWGVQADVSLGGTRAYKRV